MLSKLQILIYLDSWLQYAAKVQNFSHISKFSSTFFFVYYSRIIFGYPRLSTLNTSGFAASTKLKNARKVHFSCIFQKKVVSLQIKNLLRSTIDNRILINYKNRVNETNIFVISSIIATHGDG